MNFADIAALYIHDVKNDLLGLATGAAARGEAATQAAALRAGETLAKLLALYRTGAGGVHPNVGAACPADLVDEVRQSCAGLGEAELVTDSAGAPQFAFFDEDLVRFALNNAIQNALRVARREVRIEAASAGGFLEFRVADDGPGFPAAILDAYASLSDAPVQPLSPRKGIGGGLGLALSRSMVRAHQREDRVGYLRISNGPGGRFVLGLPQ